MKDPSPKPPYPELEQWLRRATKRLIPSARETIRAEITGHFNDAVDAARTAGIPEPEAIDRALLDLGSPHRANRLYRRQYLTNREWRRISDDLETAECSRKCPPLLVVGGGVSLLPILILGFFLLFLWSRDTPPSSRPSTMLIAGLVTAAFGAYLLIRTRLIARARDFSLFFQSLEKILYETAFCFYGIYLLDRLDTVGWLESLPPHAHLAVLAGVLILCMLVIVGCELRRTYRPWAKYRAAQRRGELDASPT
jgi:hypothetical protein